MDVETRVKELNELQARQRAVLEHKELSDIPAQPERENKEDEPGEDEPEFLAMDYFKGAVLFFVGWLIICVVLWHGIGLLWDVLLWSGLLGPVVGIFLLVLSLRAVVDMLWSGD